MRVQPAAPLARPAESERSGVRDHLVRTLRDRLIRIGRLTDAFLPATCDCTRPECSRHAPERLVTERLLRAIHFVAQEGDLDGCDPGEVQNLIAQVITVGASFGFYVCRDPACTNPDCYHRRPETAPIPAHLEFVVQRWHCMSGCLLKCRGERPESHEVSFAHSALESNLTRLESLASAIQRLTPAGIDRIQAAHVEVASTPWYRDAYVLVQHGADTWMEGHSGHPVVRLALLAAERIDLARGGSPSDSAAFSGAIRGAVLAALTAGIAHPALTQTLSGPIRGILPDL